MLVKAAMFGCDANWGRIACAIGYSGVEIDPARVAIRLGDVEVMRDGVPVVYREEDAAGAVAGQDVVIAIDLGVGSGEAAFWSCDLTDEYVRINAAYRT